MQRSTRSAREGHPNLLKALSLATIMCIACGTCGGCATGQAGSFRFTGAGMEDGVATMRQRAPPSLQVVIVELAQDRSSLFHFIRGNLAGMDTRGAAATLATTDLAKEQCLLHPKSAGVKPKRNWDVIYDETEQRQEEKRSGLQNPLDALLLHELLGHIVPVMRDPPLIELVRESQKLREENERDAIKIENEYRKHVGLPLVPVPRTRSRE